jgi:hypothetical protein
MRTTRTKRSGAVLVLAGALLCAGPADAQAPAGPAAPPAAKAAFAAGLRLAEAGQWGDAIEEFKRSSLLWPSARTTYNIGFCEYRLKHLTRARKAYSVALSAPAGQLPPDNRAIAEKELEEIEKKLARASTTVRPAGAAVSVDGAPLELDAPNGPRARLVAGTRDKGPAEIVPEEPFMLLLDPGVLHRIVVSPPSGSDLVVNRTFEPGTETQLLLARPVTVLPPRRAGAIAAFVMGGVGFAGALIFGGLALGKKNALDAVCRADCPETARPSIDALTKLANASTLGFVVASVGAALGTTLWITGAPAKPQTAVSLGAGQARLRLSF